LKETARQLLNEAGQERVVKAIQAAERCCTAEIRVHLEDVCHGDALKRASAVFAQLKMHKTAERNGVLIYVAVQSHKMAVFADAGIHEKAGALFWQKEVDLMKEHFALGDYGGGLSRAIKEAGRILAHFYPVLGSTNPDELSNDVSFGS
jgi:uncharacterized membrane protein